MEQKPKHERDVELLRLLTESASAAETLAWRWSSLIVTLNVAGIAASITWLTNVDLPYMVRFALLGFGALLNCVWCGIIQDTRYVHDQWLKAAEQVTDDGDFSRDVKAAVKAGKHAREYPLFPVGFASRWMYWLAGLFAIAWAAVSMVP